MDFQKWIFCQISHCRLGLDWHKPIFIEETVRRQSFCCILRCIVVNLAPESNCRSFPLNWIFSPSSKLDWSYFSSAHQARIRFWQVYIDFKADSDIQYSACILLGQASFEPIWPKSTFVVIYVVNRVKSWFWLVSIRPYDFWTTPIEKVIFKCLAPYALWGVYPEVLMALAQPSWGI